MGTPANRAIDCLLADQTFDGQIIDGHGNWGAPAKWTIGAGVANYEQGLGPGRPSIFQYISGWEVGEQYTIELDVLSIECGGNPDDGLRYRWGANFSARITGPGHYASNWECAGPNADYFDIIPPEIHLGGGLCTIDNCFLYLQTAAAFEFFLQNWMPPDGTRYEEYGVNGDFVTWYHHKLDSTHLAVKYSPP